MTVEGILCLVLIISVGVWVLFFRKPMTPKEWDEYERRNNPFHE